MHAHNGARVEIGKTIFILSLLEPTAAAAGIVSNVFYLVWQRAVPRSACLYEFRCWQEKVGRIRTKQD